MAEVKCPNCGTIISLEASDVESVVRQVRDEEFARDLAERTAAFVTEKAQAVKLAQTQAASEAKDALAAKDAEIARLKAQMEAAQSQAQTQLVSREAELRSDAQAQVAQLQAKLDAQSEAFAAEKELAVTRAVAAVQRENERASSAVRQERDQLKLAVEAKDLEKAALEAQMHEKMAEQVEARDAIIRLREEELERLKDMRSRLSTKMLGESLEQHCADEFNRIRAAAFPNAYFEKDTEYGKGVSKGDFIFREEDGEGNELISIMFEMKNEGDTDSRKTRNEDHLAKLDRNRMARNCEYAVLVSLLEPESELYNTGIVDVSHRFPKMYVIRPQFFIPLISLLRNAALNALQYKQEAALMRQQNLDITNFEAEIDAFKTSFFRNYENASKRFEDAIGDIDRTIKLLERIKDNLTKSEKHLTAANNKLDDLTVKRLTRKSPTVRALFEEAKEEDAD